MRTFDLTPMHRFAIGFDRMQRQLDRMMTQDEGQVAYPPYNIEVVGEDAYRIAIALAGFSADEIDITQHESTLIVSGRAAKEAEQETRYLHRGIAKRNFERRFELADHVKVTRADLADGMLTVELVREVPEALKPRKIEIGGVSGSKTIEHKAA